MNIIFKPQNYSPLTKNSHSQLLPESSRDRAGELMVPAQESSKHSSRQTKPTFCHSPSGLIALASSASQMLDCRLIGVLWPFPGWCQWGWESPAHLSCPQVGRSSHSPSGPCVSHCISAKCFNQFMGVISPNSTSAFLHSHHSQACAKAVKTHLHLLPSQSTASL